MANEPVGETCPAHKSVPDIETNSHFGAAAGVLESAEILAPFRAVSGSLLQPSRLGERSTSGVVAATPDEVVNSSMYPLEWKEKSTGENWKVPGENEN
ncbi:hypothetical protein G5I_05675 [Acromyrmex echinatior]|uniref:Uncharacterized protein n=1 Tax=Acromyrmex echinatior TaxID=103372 RepID=F4WIZ9_ACREC|nr:hypothetical protein G5I_05675 [Acromyrmex echinatior]